MAVSTYFNFYTAGQLDPLALAANPAATSLADGGVFVTGDAAGATDGVIYDSASAITGDVTGLAGTGSSVAQLGNGNIVIVTDRGLRLTYEIVDGSGAVVVPAAPPDNNAVDESHADVAALTGGGFVIVCDTLKAAGDRDIRVLIRGADGAPVTSFNVDVLTTNDRAPTVAGLADGGFVVSWYRSVGAESELWYAVYEANGTVRKAATMLDNGGTIARNPSAVGLLDGGFAIAYEKDEFSSGIDVWVQRFAADGTPGLRANITYNFPDHVDPSTTLMSNGMIFVGCTQDGAGVRWNLVDPVTLFPYSSYVMGTADWSSTAVAGMDDAQVMAFYANAATSQVEGKLFQLYRESNGDAAADTIVGDSLIDYVNGGDGNDTIRGGGGADHLNGEGGDDAFEVGDALVGTSTIDGGAGQDRILALDNASFALATLNGIEEVEFAEGNLSATTVTLLAAQLGTGVASDLLVDGNATGVADTLRVVMGTSLSVNLSGLTFLDFDTAGIENDRVTIIGDADAETIVGSPVPDVILGNGGNDKITGGGGLDLLRGGPGDDTYLVNAAGEAREDPGEGTDTVKSNTTYTLGDNIEVLVLTGAGAIDGSGNAIRNTLTGNAGANTLRGGAGNDVITGGLGTDVLNGGADRDRFTFYSTADSLPGLGTRDTIQDFAGNGALAGDSIDLSGIDADEPTAGNQAFTFIGSAAFSAVGQVRYAGGLLQANTDGDLAAEFEVKLTGAPPLVAGDLVL